MKNLLEIGDAGSPTTLCIMKVMTNMASIKQSYCNTKNRQLLIKKR